MFKVVQSKMNQWRQGGGKKRRIPILALALALLICFTSLLRAEPPEPSSPTSSADETKKEARPLITFSPKPAAPTAAPAESKKTVVQPPSTANQGPNVGPIVREVVIEYVGSRNVAKEVILSNMRTTVGQPFSPSAIEEDVRNLYATGFFINLRIYDEPVPNGVKVVIVVQPKPTLKEIIIKGAQKISEKAIRKKITTKVGDTLSEQKVSADAQTIRDYYQDKNFKSAQVEYKIDVNEQLGRAVVTYTITENKKQIIKDIVFEGNKSFKEKELRKVMKTKTQNWLSFINKSGRYKDEQIQDDLKALRDFYWDHGYIDMSVKDVVYETYGNDALRIKIKIFEGIPYQVGKVTIENNTLFTTDVIRNRMKMLEGKTYSPRGLQEDIKAVKDLYGEKGYIDAEAAPKREPNVESGRMDLSYKITEGPQFFVEQIIIQGNNRTKDKVLRRELALAPGDVYDSVRAEASKKRLENLDYFSKVDVTSQDAGVPGRRNMVVTVEEKRTGSVSFGAGFSTIDSVIGFVELTQGNFDIAKFPTFTGGGQKFRTRLQYGLRRKDFVINLTEPWFLNQKLSLGLDLFYNESNYLSSKFDQRRYGGAVRLARALNEFWTIGVRYQLENIEIFNLSNDASQLIRNEAGSRTKSSVRGTLVYDSRDNVFLTRKGEKVEFFAEGAGGPLLGDTKIWSLGTEAQKFFLLPYDLIFMVNGATSVVGTHSGGTRVPIFDRLFVGGNRTVRGFGYRDIGPRDATSEPIGGNTMGYGNLELTYPIIERVRGAVFLDAGFDNLKPFNYDLSDYQAAVGFGFRMNLPIGPLRIDFGFPIVHDKDNNQTFKFHFDVGYQF